MNDFKNDAISREYKRKNSTIFIGLGILFLSIVLLIFMIWKENKSLDSLHELILNNSNRNEKGYIDVAYEPYKFAFYEGESDYFYYVLDKEYMYVVRMSDEDYARIKNADINNVIRIEGVTKILPDDIKQIGIEIYNENIDNEPLKNANDFDDYFGKIYIDLSALSTEEVSIMVCIVFIIIGGIIICVGFFQKYCYSKNLKQLTEEERKKLDDELNDKDSFYYKEARIYLTKNYIFNFSGTFEAIPYKDIIWIYPYEIRNRGFKTGQSIQVMTNNGKLRSIAYMSVYTKKLRLIYDEVYDTLLSKNDSMLKGFSKENKKKASEKIKE